jgi:DtxR family transcriptional regulator, Mn-dependent transcriptional regulator
MGSISREDYIRAMYHIKEEEGSVKSVRVADYLNVSKPSVSEMLHSLDSDGLISYERYSEIKLTKKGLELARKLTMRHRIIEIFLYDFLKINPKKVHNEANNLEHAFSDESIEKIKKLLGNPKEDPHGKPIPVLH